MITRHVRLRGAGVAALARATDGQAVSYMKSNQLLLPSTTFPSRPGPSKPFAGGNGEDPVVVGKLDSSPQAPILNQSPYVGLKWAPTVLVNSYPTSPMRRDFANSAIIWSAG